MTTDVIPMEVVFTQDVPNKARAGEVRRVPDGYARNYLLPQGLAQMATPEVLKRLHKIKSVGDQVRMRETRVLEEIQEALDNTEISVQARVTPTGRYYGAITATHISMALAEVTGREIERRWIEVAEPIREPGEYDITLRLSTEIAANIRVTAEAEE
jgi:large subunit ribosomal protein L9